MAGTAAQPWRLRGGETVDIVDLNGCQAIDEASIETACRNVAAAGLTDRVRPAVHDASRPDLGGPYEFGDDLRGAARHEPSLAALRSARASVAAGRSVVIAGECVADRFTTPGDEIERLNYGWSILQCLAVGLLDEDSAGTGTVIRADTIRAYAASSRKPTKRASR